MDQEIAGEYVEVDGPPDVVPARIEKRLDELAVMEQAIRLSDKVAEVALALTKHHDWTFFGDRPWLCRSGAERIRNRLGISIEILPDPVTKRRYTQYEITDDEGSYIVVEYAAKVSHPHFGSIEALGFATSRDKLLGSNGPDSDGKLIWKPITEVNLTHIRMKAFSNLWVNAITRFCGVTPSRDRLVELFGDKVAKVEFRDKADKRTPETVAEESKKARALWAILVTMNEGDEKSAGEGLAALTAFQGDKGPVAGVKDINRLKGRRLEIACEKGKDLWNDFLKKNPDRADALRASLKGRIDEKGGAA